MDNPTHKYHTVSSRVRSVILFQQCGIRKEQKQLAIIADSALGWKQPLYTLLSPSGPGVIIPFYIEGDISLQQAIP